MTRRKKDVERVMLLVEEFGDPKRMPLQEWVNFLTAIQEEVEMKLEAARDDLRRGRS